MPPPSVEPQKIEGKGFIMGQNLEDKHGLYKGEITVE